MKKSTKTKAIKKTTKKQNNKQKNNSKKLALIFGIAAGILILAGCGFHLLSNNDEFGGMFGALANNNRTNMSDGSVSYVPITSIQLSSPGSLYEGQNITLTPKILPSNATHKEITCKSSNTKLVTVKASGSKCIVKVAKITNMDDSQKYDNDKILGTVNITVTAKYGGLSSSIKVRITPYIPVENVVINPNYEEGSTKTYDIELLPSNASNQKITCKIDNKKVASITTSGKKCILKIKKKHKTFTITVTAADGKNVSLDGDSYVKAKTASFPAKNYEVKAGETIAIPMKISPKDYDWGYFWCDTASIGKDPIAIARTGGSDGTTCYVTGKKAGTVTIVGGADDHDSSAKATIKVIDNKEVN